MSSTDTQIIKITKIGIVGGGPSGMFMLKKLLESDAKNIEIHIFEKSSHFGSGMPYSEQGANPEHITNVSDNEIPEIVNNIKDWVMMAPKQLLDFYNITPENFNEYKVLPRLFFGQYLAAQFDLLVQKAKKNKIEIKLYKSCEVIDIIDKETENQVWLQTLSEGTIKCDSVVICSGHSWPRQHEGAIPGYYDSPYPPSKLALVINHPVAIRGSSLTAIDAIRTLAKHNGTFIKNENGLLSFMLNPESIGFKIVLHSKNGFLPAVRFHLEDTHLHHDSLLTEQQIAEHIKANEGFLSLDFVFEKNFKDIFKDKEPEFYQRIKDMTIEEFVDDMMELRERVDAFSLFKAEYAQAQKSIKRQQSVYWKEMLAVLSFAMNYPAKHLSAEDMQRLQSKLMPLISLVIAFVPQSSCRELMALHDTGLLDIVAVGTDNEIETKPEGGIIYHYQDENDNKISAGFDTFIDCIGQKHLSYPNFPFKSLLKEKRISPAKLRFRSAELGKLAFEQDNTKICQDAQGNYYLNVAGITINDSFQIIDQFGAYNERIYIMAIPYIGGYNPDYSGLDFCDACLFIDIGLAVDLIVTVYLYLHKLYLYG